VWAIFIANSTQQQGLVYSSHRTTAGPSTALSLDNSRPSTALIIHNKHNNGFFHPTSISLPPHNNRSSTLLSPHNTMAFNTFAFTQKQGLLHFSYSTTTRTSTIISSYNSRTFYAPFATQQWDIQHLSDHTTAGPFTCLSPHKKTRQSRLLSRQKESGRSYTPLQRRRVTRFFIVR
jgi:hypothetical protein